MSRLAAELRSSRAQIAWLCVTPGPHISWMVESAVGAGLHVIAEKPWLCSPAQTNSLVELAKSKRILLGVHFEYCLLDEIQKWRAQFVDTTALRFHGRFQTSLPDRLHLPAIVNLGCHLLAIRRYAVPRSTVGDLSCSYCARDQRVVWMETADGATRPVDYTRNREPVIQRFLQRFEAGIAGAEFPFGFEFALSVAEDLVSYRDRQTAEFPGP